MAKPLKIATDRGVFVLCLTREQAMADASMNAEDKRVYLAMLEIAEKHCDRQRGPLGGESESHLVHRKSRPKLDRARRRR